MSEKKIKVFLPIRPMHVLSRLWYAVNLLNNDCAIPSPQNAPCQIYANIQSRPISAYFCRIFRDYMVRIFWKNVRVFLTCLSVCHIISHILVAAEVNFGQIGFFYAAQKARNVLRLSACACCILSGANIDWQNDVTRSLFVHIDTPGRARYRQRKRAVNVVALFTLQWQ